MSLGNGVLGCGNRCSEFIGLSGVFLTVDCVSYAVTVRSQCRIKNKVLGRHGFRNVPTGEGVSLGHGVFGCGNCCSEFIGLSGVFLTVDGISDAVTVHSQCRIKNKVLGRHGFRNIPTGESVSLGHGVFGCGNRCSEFIGLSGVFLTVDCVGNRIAVGRVLSGNGHVFRNV